MKTRGLRNRHGFTLIELSVVLVIIGMLSAMIIPRLPDVGDWRLRSSARRLAATMSYLYDKAATSQLVYRLTLDMDKGEYYVSLLNTDNQFEKTELQFARDTTLPGEVKIIRALTQMQGKALGGKITIHFLPTGFMDLAIVELTDNAKNFYTLTSNPLTGQVKITVGKSNVIDPDSRESAFSQSPFIGAA